MHEQLQNYLSPTSGAPTGVSAPEASPRHPMPSPKGAVPKGKRPIPASSESNRKTNTQIPYPRVVLKTSPWEAPPISVLSDNDLNLPLDRRLPREGDIVFVERGADFASNGGHSHAALVKGTASNGLCRVRTMQDVNARLKELDGKTGGLFVPARSQLGANVFNNIDVFVFPWELDGVINNIDGGDVDNEYKDYTLANVALQGQCRLRFDGETRGPIEPRVTHTQATVFVGLFAWRNRDNLTFNHRLVRFTSAEVARNLDWLAKIAMSVQGRSEALQDYEMTCVWTVGKVLDANQAPDMITLLVGVDQVPISSVMPGHASVPDYQRYLDVEGREQTGVLAPDRYWPWDAENNRVQLPRQLKTAVGEDNPLIIERWSDHKLLEDGQPGFVFSEAVTKQMVLKGDEVTRADQWNVLANPRWNFLVRMPALVISRRYGQGNPNQ
jgi:hypothetical protein